MRSDIPRHTVRVVYTEPEFQRRTPDAPAEYQFDYRDIAASSEDDAVAAAVRRFWHTASLSRMGWRRCIQSVRVLNGPARPTGRPGPAPRDHS